MANNHHPTKEMPTGNGHSTAGEANNDLDFPTGERSSAVFQELRAGFKRKGHTLFQIGHRDGAQTYWAERWGLVRYLPTIDDARRFLDQIGGRL
jgi:hypothetical protein